MKRVLFWFVTVLLSAAAPGSIVGASEWRPAPEMIGHWDGNGRIIVTWCEQTNVAVALQIKDDGTVSGKVGDATLENGRIERNRGWIGRKLNLKTDYVITGRLSGPIVASEEITRSAVSMPFNFRNDAFVGGLHTSGSKFGGKEKMILSATSLSLRRTGAEPPAAPSKPPDKNEGAIK